RVWVRFDGPGRGPAPPRTRPTGKQGPRTHKRCQSGDLPVACGPWGPDLPAGWVRTKTTAVPAPACLRRTRRASGRATVGRLALRGARRAGGAATASEGWPPARPPGGWPGGYWTLIVRSIAFGLRRAR